MSESDNVVAEPTMSATSGCRLQQQQRQEPVPVLVSLAVVAPDTAVNGGGGAWTVPCGALDTDVATLEATCAPNEAASWRAIVWTGAGTVVEGSDNRRVTVPRNALGTPTVRASLGGVDLEARVTVAPVLDRILDVAGAAAVDGRRFKFHRADDAFAVVEARTIPNTQEAWERIAWGGGAEAGDQANRQRVPRAAVREFAITAALGGRDDRVDVRVCQLPVLSLRSVVFEGHAVDNDTGAAFSLFHWLAGRDDAENRVPACYTRNTPVGIRVRLLVDTQPTEREPVRVTATSTFGATVLTWAFTADVAPNAVSVAESLDSDVALPDVVEVYEDQEITWRYNPAGTGDVDAGSTRHLLYAVRADPLPSVAAGHDRCYWTVLDVACRPARGLSAERAVAEAIFDRFADLNTRIRRKRDNHRLGYWTAPGTEASGRSTTELLANAHGSGQCGAWAYFFLDCLRVHGIATARRVEVHRDPDANICGFLVKNWNFSPSAGDVPDDVKGFMAFLLYTVPTSRKDAFTHLKNSECRTRPPNGVPGQHNANPPPQFSNHFIVRYDGRVWDPSYGIGPFASFRAWEDAAIAGLYIHYRGKLRAGYDTAKRIGTDPQLLSYSDNYPGTGGVLSGRGNYTLTVDM